MPETRAQHPTRSPFLTSLLTRHVFSNNSISCVKGAIMQMSMSYITISRDFNRTNYLSAVITI